LAEHNLDQALIAANSIETVVAKDLQDLSGVSTALRLRLLQRVDAVLSKLAMGGQAAAVQSARAIMLTEVASASGVLGAYDQAMRRVGEALKILLTQVEAHPADVPLRLGLAKSYKVYADVLWWQRRDLDLATAALERSITLYGALIDAHPEHADVEDWKLLKYRALIGIGDIYFDRSSAANSICATREACLARAQGYFELGLGLAHSLSHRDDRDFHVENSILVSRERLAKVYEALDNAADAEATYTELLREYERISDVQPDNSKWKENLVALYWHVGRIDEKNCRLEQALADYRRALELARRLHRSEPDRTDWSHELSLSLMHVARAHELSGAFDDATAHYRESLSINRELINKQPTNEELKAEAGKVQAALETLGSGSLGCHDQQQPRSAQAR